MTCVSSAIDLLVTPINKKAGLLASIRQETIFLLQLSLEKRLG
jgi:hypothetical protein